MRTPAHDRNERTVRDRYPFLHIDRRTTGWKVELYAFPQMGPGYLLACGNSEREAFAYAALMVGLLNVGIDWRIYPWEEIKNVINQYLQCHPTD